MANRWNLNSLATKIFQSARPARNHNIRSSVQVRKEADMTPFGIGGLELGFILLWLLFFFSGVAGWVAALVALWRIMKAHEKLAAGIEQLASKMNPPIS
jgi:hypothetical protein